MAGCKKNCNCTLPPRGRNFRCRSYVENKCSRSNSSNTCFSCNRNGYYKTWIHPTRFFNPHKCKCKHRCK